MTGGMRYATLVNANDKVGDAALAQLLAGITEPRDGGGVRFQYLAVGIV